MAPILNRFCLVNLRYESSRAFLDEFLQDESERSDDLIVYGSLTITEETKRRLREGLKTMWTAIFDSFNDDNGGSSLDINNQLYNNIYESDTMYVYNFITGRTVYYLYQITLSFLRLGLSVSRHGPLMLNMVFGLVGLGANTFGEMQQKSYLKKLETLWTKLYAAFETGADGAEPAAGRPPEKIDFGGKSVSEAINEWMLYREASVFEDGADTSLAALAAHISGVYGPADGQVEAVRRRIEGDTPALLAFTGDMQKIDYLIDCLTDNADIADALPLEPLQKIRGAYAILREAALEAGLKR
jgi:hypothetical protein